MPWGVMMSEPCFVTRRQVHADPFIVWNEYVGLLAHADFHALTNMQRAAYLVFWYESEVQNGGHLQYFENRGGAEAQEAVTALGRLGASCQARVLARAVARYVAKTRPEIASVTEYVEVALEGEFDDLDREFHDCRPSLVEALQKYLEQHQGEFVLIGE
jgi:Domain of unknown function (DUF4375)